VRLLAQRRHRVQQVLVVILETLCIFARVRTEPGKVWNANCKFSRSGKSWKMTLGMEKFGKVMESVMADLENCSARASIVPSFGYTTWTRKRHV